MAVKILAFAGSLRKDSYNKKLVNCRGCENRCTVTKITFQNSNIFYTGNRCERTFSNRGKQVQKGAYSLPVTSEGDFIGSGGQRRGWRKP